MHLNENSVGGLFSFLNTAASKVTNLSTNIIQGKQAYDATKAAWRGVPYASPQNLSVPPYLAAPVSAAKTAAPWALPGGSGERLIVERVLTSQELAEIQKTLNSMGFNTGTVDGVYGPNTAAGIRGFQSAYNLAADGKPSMRLLQAVRGATQSSILTQPQTIYTPPQQQIPPYATGTFPNSDVYRQAETARAAQKTTEEKLWTWFIPGAAAIGGLLFIMMQNKGRR